MNNSKGIESAARIAQEEWQAYDLSSPEPYVPSDHVLEAAYDVFAPCDYNRCAVERWAHDNADYRGWGVFLGTYPGNGDAILESNRMTCYDMLRRLGTSEYIDRDALHVELIDEHGALTAGAAFMYGAERFISDEYPILDDEDAIAREYAWLTDYFDRTIDDDDIPAGTTREEAFNAWIDIDQPNSSDMNVNPERVVECIRLRQTA